MELSEQTKKLISQYQIWHQSKQPKQGPVIHVDEIASRVAAFYEKIRGIIDWREEHLLRRTAIERSLKRRLVAKKDGQQVAEPLLLEMIRGGHFPNDKIEENKVLEVQKIINKYVFILENAPSPKENLKIRLMDWLSGLTACEIEETLDSPIREKALITQMYNVMKERIKIREGAIVFHGMSEEEKNTQIFIACQRSLFKLDAALISYYLLKIRYSDWKEAPPSLLSEVSQNIYSIWEKIEADLAHPYADKFYQACERYDTAFLLLGDVVSDDPLAIPEKIKEPEVLEGQIREAYSKRLKTLKSRLARAAVYITVSIFITKVATALAMEIPIDKYLTGHFNFLAIIINILVPPLLMLFLVLTIHPPERGNFEKVLMEVMGIAYERKEKNIFYEIKLPRKKGIVLYAIISLIYLLSFGLSIGVIVWLLTLLNFPVFSQVIFILFVSLISFAGTKIRQRSKELQVIETKERIFHLLIDLFSLPLIRLGRWISGKWKKYNVIATFFDALIEMPFMVFVEFLEQWRYFLKEKKEEIH